MYRHDKSEIEQSDSDTAMYLSIPDADKVLREFDGIVDKLEELGIEVSVLEGKNSTQKTPNMIYLRDVAFVYKSDIILARMKYAVREGEPAKFLNLIREQHPELLFHIKNIDRGNLEGADLLVKSENEILTYTGSRTSVSALKELQKVYPNVKFTNIPANIAGVPQHLLGGIHIVDRSVLTRRIKYCSTEIEQFNLIDFDEDEEVGRGFSLNILTVGPGEILMPKNRYITKAAFEANGIICHEVEIDETHKMGGGLACMILPIARSET